MTDYVIWCGEKYWKTHPDLTWEQVMDIITSKELGPEYSISEYLKQR